MDKLKLLRKLFFALPLSEADFSRRGFLKNQAAQNRLEYVAKVVVGGYNTALETGFSNDLLVSRKMIIKEDVGFFNEGIGMGLFTLDLVSVFKKDRFWEFIKDKGKHHEYMAYIGAGIACGVFKILPIKKFIAKSNPTCGLLLLNGVGFYYAYFKPKKTLGNNFYVPKKLLKDSFKVYSYDNGIGRALWFVHGGNPQSIQQNIDKFPVNRRAGIWSGVGLAATYAGGVDQSVIAELIERSGEYKGHLKEGSMLAVHTRDLAGNPHKKNDTAEFITRKTLKECTSKARQLRDELENRRFIGEKHSLDFFFHRMREWLQNDESFDEALVENSKNNILI